MVVRNPPTISVVIPCLNAATFVEAAVRSALAQDPPPLEVIVQDGGSTDGTLAILNSINGPITRRSEPDRGQADALNQGIDRSSGDVVVWLNGDDLLAPGAFAAVCAAYAEQPDAAMVYGDFEVIDALGSVLRRFRSAAYEPGRVFTRGCYIFSGTMFLRRELIEQVGPFDTRFQTCMDFDFLMRIGNVKAVHAGRTLAQFRMAGNQKTRTMRSRFLRESHEIRWRAANGSVSRRVLTLMLDVRDTVYLLTQRVRMTRAWSAVRGTREL